MQSRQGERTGEFGRWLTRYLRDLPLYAQYSVYYDHGDSQSQPNVAETKGFLGDLVTRRNWFASVDVMVAKPNKDIVALIEIEERAVTPKKLLGDVFAILMCNRFAVRVSGEQRYFEVMPETRLIVAGVVPTRGHRRRKIEEVIEPRLKQFVTPSDSISPQNVSLIFRRDILTVVGELENIIRGLFPKDG